VTGPVEVPANRWPVNKAALAWLRKAKVPVDPEVAYLPQLAAWGLITGQVHLHRMVGRPDPDDVEHLVMALVFERGPQEAASATRELLSNPNLSEEEQRSCPTSEGRATRGRRRCWCWTT
jgi:hypothetical protein